MQEMKILAEWGIQGTEFSDIFFTLENSLAYFGSDVFFRNFLNIL